MMNRYVVYGCAFMVREVEFEECCNFSPVSTSVALIKYPVMIPFLSWGRGGIHVRRMERGEVATARKFSGKPLGAKGEQDQWDVNTKSQSTQPACITHNAHLTLDEIKFQELTSLSCPPRHHTTKGTQTNGSECCHFALVSIVRMQRWCWVRGGGGVWFLFPPCLHTGYCHSVSKDVSILLVRGWRCPGETEGSRTKYCDSERLGRSSGDCKEGV